ncbi:hypothetical protein ACFYPZ_37275, partial [Streptomyces sp. NPDC005506]
MDTFAGRLDGGWEWWSAAIEEAQEGRWVRDAVERQVMKDIGAATNRSYPVCVRESWTTGACWVHPERCWMRWSPAFASRSAAALRGAG